MFIAGYSTNTSRVFVLYGWIQYKGKMVVFAATKCSNYKIYVAYFDFIIEKSLLFSHSFFRSLWSFNVWLIYQQTIRNCSLLAIIKPNGIQTHVAVKSVHILY